jgi:hypothetical protein
LRGVVFFAGFGLLGERDRGRALRRALVALFEHLQAGLDGCSLAFGLMAAAHFPINAALHPAGDAVRRVAFVVVRLWST